VTKLTSRKVKEQRSKYRVKFFNKYEMRWMPYCDECSNYAFTKLVDNEV